MAEAVSPPRLGAAEREARCAALRERMRSLGLELAAAERDHAPGLARAREAAGILRGIVAQALAAFHEAARAAGAPQLEVALGAARPDEKHLRAVQFDLRRGRHAAIVTVKSRGEVTLVGPFRQGKAEGPCKSFPIDAEPEIEAALAEFLTAFLREAATP
jgi:hypothetical protein